MHYGNSHNKRYYVIRRGIIFRLHAWSPGKIIFSSSGPIIQKTRLGWKAAAGPILKSNTNTEYNVNITLMSQVVIHNLGFRNDIERCVFLLFTFY